MADSEAMQQAIMQAAKEARKATVKALTEINEGNRRPDTGTRQVIMGKDMKTRTGGPSLGQLVL